MGPWILHHILTMIIVSPFVGVLLLAVTPKRYDEASRNIALSMSSITLLMSLIMLSLFSPASRFGFIDTYSYYAVGVDGLGALMVVAVSVIAFFAVLSSWGSVKEMRREFFGLILLAEIGFLGVFSSIDILTMLIFSEFAVAAVGGLVLISGSSSKDAARFVGFMSVASILLMIVVVSLAAAAGSTGLDVVEKIVLDQKLMRVGAIILLVSVAIRMGIFPFNSWRTNIRSRNIQALVALIGLSGGFIFYRLYPSFFYATTMMRSGIMIAIITALIVSALIAFSKKEVSAILTAVLQVLFCFFLLGLMSVTHEGVAGAGMLMVAIAFASLLISVYISRPIFFVLAATLMAIPGFIVFPGIFMLWMGLFKGSYIFALLSLVGLLISSISLILPLTQTLKKENGEEIGPLMHKKALLLAVFPAALVIVFGLFPNFILHFVDQSTEGLWKLITSL